MGGEEDERAEMEKEISGEGSSSAAAEGSSGNFALLPEEVPEDPAVLREEATTPTPTTLFLW